MMLQQPQLTFQEPAKLITMALKLKGQGYLPQAYDLCKIIIAHGAINDFFEDAHFIAGSICRELEHNGMAAYHFKEAYNHDPSLDRAQDLIKSLFESEDFVGVETLCCNILNEDNNSHMPDGVKVNLMLWRVDAMSKLGWRDSALVILKEAEDICNKSSEIYEELQEIRIYIQHQRIVILDDLGETTLAKNILNEILLQLSQLDQNMLLGQFALGESDLDAAIKHFRLAAECEPDNDHVTEWLRDSLMGGQRFAEALPYAQCLVTNNPLSVSAHLDLAECEAQLDHIDEAREGYLTAISLCENLRAEGVCRDEYAQFLLSEGLDANEAMANLNRALLITYAQKDSEGAFFVLRDLFRVAESQGNPSLMKQAKAKLVGLERTLEETGKMPTAFRPFSLA